MAHQPDEGAVAQGERSGKVHVVLGAADCSRRKDEHLIGYFFMKRPAEMFADHTVGCNGQVRAVLFGRCNGENYGNVAVQFADLLRSELVPVHGQSFEVCPGRNEFSGK